MDWNMMVVQAKHDPLSGFQRTVDFDYPDNFADPEEFEFSNLQVWMAQRVYTPGTHYSESTPYSLLRDLHSRTDHHARGRVRTYVR